MNTYRMAPEVDWEIPVEAVVKTYRGRQGCGCGCNGIYSDRPSTNRKRTADVNAGILHAHFVGPFDMDGEEVFCASLDNADGGTVWAYFSASVNPPLVPVP